MSSRFEWLPDLKRRHAALREATKDAFDTPECDLRDVAGQLLSAAEWFDDRLGWRSLLHRLFCGHCSERAVRLEETWNNFDREYKEYLANQKAPVL